MNHGHCKDCGWWERMSDSKGTCHMSVVLKETDRDSYCPDYVNRRKFDYRK